MVVQLMKYGADPSLIDGEGCSCVHLAAQFGHTSIVAYLIAKGQVDESSSGLQRLNHVTRYSSWKRSNLCCFIAFFLFSVHHLGFGGHLWTKLHF